MKMMYSLSAMFSSMRKISSAARAVLLDFALYFNPKTKWGRIRLIAAVAALVVIGMFVFGGNNEPAQVEEDARGVRLTRVGSFGDSASLELVGTVEAVDQATIEAEVGGRVTSVRVGLGDRVSAGQVIATLENASQYASLLQAEGSYEAAVAAAAQSDVSVSSAQTARAAARNDAINTFRSAYTTASSIVLNNIDEFFTNPDAQVTPGLKLDGYGYTSYLNDERVAFQDLLTEWREEANALSNNDDLQTALNNAEARTNRVKEMVDAFIVLLNEQEPPSAYTEAELDAFSTTFTGLRANLNATLLSIENARTSLATAEETLRRAEISGTGGEVSVADANVKQALGALRAAQANYNRTILRSPIAGVVQTLAVKQGDYIGALTTAATVANQDALLITTFVSESERDRIEVGSTVAIEGGASGTITAIAPSVDPATGKIEVRIQSESTELQNGDVVDVAIETPDRPLEERADDPIIIPITALKVETDRIIVFTVNDDGVLVAHEVTEGPILGSSIMIESGVTPDMEIVTDARGLNEGDRVTVIEG